MYRCGIIAKALLGLGCAVLIAHSATARDITINDIIGRWCGDTTNYTFSPSDMIVTPVGNTNLKHPPRWVIDKVGSDGNKITVFWKPADPSNSTVFVLDAADRTLIQQPEKVGDKGPRRVFHRC
jgi:hypothetical protein